MRLGKRIDSTRDTDADKAASKAADIRADKAAEKKDAEVFADKNAADLSTDKAAESGRLRIVNAPIEVRRALEQRSAELFAVCLVDFHHQRGPEVQWWRSDKHPTHLEGLFRNLAFQALPDGAHLFEETFSNFNLVYDTDTRTLIDDIGDMDLFRGDPRHLQTLFGCSCVRQVKTSELSEGERERNAHITRLIVQKGIVVILRGRPVFTRIKEKLSIITRAYFAQDNMQDFSILDVLYGDLQHSVEASSDESEEYYVNLHLRDSVATFKTDFLRIFKCLLLEKKVMVFSNTNLELLTQFQNNLISLFPGLMGHLDLLGCPLSDYTEAHGPLQRPVLLNTSSRASMLRFYGLPLQIFNTKNSFWNPYLPLQQLEELLVRSYMIGCLNLLFVSQAEKYDVDVIVNLDTNEVVYPKGRPEELTISHADRKFVNRLVQSTRSHEGEFAGSDDYIRYQFEDYLSLLVLSVRYEQYVDRFSQPPPGFERGLGELSDFGLVFVDKWRETENYKIWNQSADEFIFNFVEPVHIGSAIEEGGVYESVSGWWKKTRVGEVGEKIKSQRFIGEEREEKKKGLWGWMGKE